MTAKIIGMALCALHLSAFADSKMTMQDLKELGRQKSWEEVIDKGDKVPASERTQEYNGLIATAGTGLLNLIAGEPGPTKQAYATAELVLKVEKKYLFLIGNANYIESKSTTLGAVTDACIKRSAHGCGTLVEMLSRGVKRFPKGYAKKIAVLMEEDGRFPSEILRFWVLAADDDSENCNQGGLQRSIINGLKMDPSADDAQSALKVAKLCGTQLASTMMETLDKAEKSSPFTRNACPLLKSQGKKNMTMREKCS